MREPWLLVLLAAVAEPAVAQQFQQVGGGLPGPVVWSEGVETLDADGDGWQDLFFANGVGFSSAGGALAPTLLMNDTTMGGTIAFLDESAARLPAGLALQGKALAVCDVEWDGDPDVVLANAFLNQPILLINDGTGHFTNETVTRLPAMALSSFGLGCGDVDGDGDLDLALADAGPSPFAARGGKLRLLVNDGTGRFADSPLAMNAVNKVGAQNAQMLDIDNDFDLDIVVDGKSSGQQLYLNAGNGAFTLAPGGTLPNGSANTYATDWADLDNDTDLDGFYISISGFSEGAVQNGLVPGGTLALTGSSATIGGLNGDDDNDIVFLDADNNGRLDVIVGSLGGAREKLYLNDGTFGPASFAYQAAGFSTVSDSTLDLSAADFDNDGRYDVATAQGESGGFTNRVYRNTGPADTTPPWIGRVQATPPRVWLNTIQAGGFAPKAWIQDATSKRRQTFVKARLDATVTKGGPPNSFTAPMRHVGGGIHRGLLQPPPNPNNLVGSDVSFVVHASDPSGNFSDSAPAGFRICGAEPFGPQVTNSSGQAALIQGLGNPSFTHNAFSVRIAGLPPNATGVLRFGAAQQEPPVASGAGVLLVAGNDRGLGRITADGSGIATLPLDFTRRPLQALHPGDTRFVQFQFTDGASWNGSNGLEIVFCD